MVYSSDRTMLLRILFLSSCCSLWLPTHSHSHQHGDEEGSASDFKGSNESGLGSDGSDSSHGSDSSDSGSDSLDSGSDSSPESSEEMHGWHLAGRNSFPPAPPALPGNPWLPVGNMMGSSQGSMDPTMGPQHDAMICDLIMNSHMPPDTQQIPFFCICSRCKGSVGPKGDRGQKGYAGYTGKPGSQGMMGMRGQPGFMGRSGIKGMKGDLGMKGETGKTGSMGLKGQRGFKGEKGDQGPMGNEGTRGLQGETGTCPTKCESIPGQPGHQGPPGPAGGQGLPGARGPVGLKGMTAAKGDLGRPGDPGMMGEKGDQGEQGVCECTDGMDGSDGQQGAKGDKGDKGDTGAQGVEGPMGMKGNLGFMGMMGLPGPCSPAIQSAFSASVDESFPRNNWPVAFPIVYTNMQNHFNPSMGMYMAPVNGTYVFSFHLSVAMKPLIVGIFLNFRPVLKTTAVQDPTTISQEVVLHLHLGDQVWLQVKDYMTNGIFVGGESASTFSGYLLHPDSCEMPLGRHFQPPLPPPTSGYSWSDVTTPSPY